MLNVVKVRPIEDFAIILMTIMITTIKIIVIIVYVSK